jgi:undecaprenyl pyrophosphate phosphatase UppP
MAGTCTQGIDTGFAALGYTKVAALGVLQGITELLPISSTAHMRLVPVCLSQINIQHYPYLKELTSAPERTR